MRGSTDVIDDWWEGGSYRRLIGCFLRWFLRCEGARPPLLCSVHKANCLCSEAVCPCPSPQPTPAMGRHIGPRFLLLQPADRQLIILDWIFDRLLNPSCLHLKHVCKFPPFPNHPTVPTALRMSKNSPPEMHPNETPSSLRAPSYSIDIISKCK